MNLNFTLILGSKSPRRKLLLEQCGFEFETVAIDTDETYPEDVPIPEVAKFIAKSKAAAYRDRLNDEVLITADTIVRHSDLILGKPAGAQEALEMLQLLSDSKHLVTTGVCICSASKLITFDDTTTVFFRELRNTEIEYYIDNYKPFDKAGAYGIQEWIGMIAVEKIEGSYFNVMGLPLHKVYHVLNEF